MRTDRGLDWDAAKSDGAPLRHFDDGVSQSGRERNHLFVNLGDGQFEDVSGLSGMDDPADGRALAILDFDRDGWPDLAAVNANAPFLQLFRNGLGDDREGPPPVISIRFEGANRSARPKPGASPRDGYGAQVEADVGDVTVVRTHRAGEGFAAQNSPHLRVGLGDHREARALRVRWPSGKRQEVQHVLAGTELTFYENPADSPDGSGASRAEFRATGAPPARPPEVGPRLEVGLPDDGASIRILTTLASWCEACVDELPQLALLKETFPGLALHGVPIDPEDSADKLGTWVRRHRPAYAVLSSLPAGDREAVQKHVRDTLGRDALPATLVTDGRGRVLETRWGPPSVSDVKRWLAGRVAVAR